MRTCGKHWFHFSASVQVGFILSWTGRLLPGCDCDMCYSTLYLGRVVPDTRLTKIELTMHALTDKGKRLASSARSLEDHAYKNWIRINLISPDKVLILGVESRNLV